MKVSGVKAVSEPRRYSPLLICTFPMGRATFRPPFPARALFRQPASSSSPPILSPTTAFHFSGHRLHLAIIRLSSPASFPRFRHSPVNDATLPLPEGISTILVITDRLLSRSVRVLILSVSISVVTSFSVRCRWLPAMFLLTFGRRHQLASSFISMIPQHT